MIGIPEPPLLPSDQYGLVLSLVQRLDRISDRRKMRWEESGDQARAIGDHPFLKHFSFTPPKDTPNLWENRLVGMPTAAQDFGPCNVLFHRRFQERGSYCLEFPNGFLRGFWEVSRRVFDVARRGAEVLRGFSLQRLPRATE